MIASIEGRCVYVGKDRVVLEVGGLGYEVAVTESLARRCKLDERYRWQTVLLVRENELTLIGFATATEREFFKLLTSISGIGPKVALKVLDRLSPSQLANCVLSNDVQRLKGVPGIGLKVAKRLLLELPEKVSQMASDLALPLDLEIENVGSASQSGEAALEGIAAEAAALLMTWGCTLEEAQGAVLSAQAQGAGENVQDLVMAAMGQLGGG